MRAPWYARPVVARLAMIGGIVCILWACCGCGGSVTGPSSEPTTPEARVVLPALPAIPAPRMFGYYAYGAAGAGCGWTNWTLVTVNSQTLSEAREKAEAARACRQVVSYVPVGPWRHWSDTFKPIAQTFADAGVLHSVYVADEPMANPVGSPLHLEYEELAGRIADVRAAGWKAMFTEQGGGIEKRHPDVDFYGLDWYDVKPHFMAEVLRKHPEINVLVAPAYGGMVQPDQGSWYAQAKQARVGLVFWLWPSDSGWVGVEDMPEVQAVHRQLWAKW